MNSNGLCQHVLIPGGLCNKKAKGTCADCLQEVCHNHGQPCERCGETICVLCEESHLAEQHNIHKPAGSITWGSEKASAA